MVLMTPTDIKLYKYNKYIVGGLIFHREIQFKRLSYRQGEFIGSLELGAKMGYKLWLDIANDYLQNGSTYRFSAVNEWWVASC